MKPKLFMRKEKNAIDVFAAYMNVNSMLATESNFSKLRREVDRAEKRIMKEVRMKRMKGVSVGRHPFFQKRGSFDGEKMVVALRLDFKGEGKDHYKDISRFIGKLGFKEKSMVMTGKKRPLNRDRRMKEILKKDKPKRRGEMPPPTKKFKDKTKYDRKRRNKESGMDKIARELVAASRELMGYSKYDRAVETGTTFKETSRSDTTCGFIISIHRSAPPLTACDIPRIENRFRGEVGKLVSLIQEDIPVKVRLNPYIHLAAANKTIRFYSYVTLSLVNKTAKNKQVFSEIMDSVLG